MKTTILLGAFFISLFACAQEIDKNSLEKTVPQKSNQLKVKSIGYGFGFFASGQDEGGLSGILEVGLIYDKNLFLLNYLSGASFTILGPAGVDVRELNLQFGRELKVNSWFSIEGFAGLGYFNQERQANSSAAIAFTALSVPLRAKFVFYTGKHFALVSNTNYSINTTSSNFSSNLTFQHVF